MPVGSPAHGLGAEPFVASERAVATLIGSRVVGLAAGEVLPLFLVEQHIRLSGRTAFVGDRVLKLLLDQVDLLCQVVVCFLEVGAALSL